MVIDLQAALDPIKENVLHIWCRFLCRPDAVLLTQPSLSWHWTVDTNCTHYGRQGGHYIFALWFLSNFFLFLA